MKTSKILAVAAVAAAAALALSGCSSKSSSAGGSSGGSGGAGGTPPSFSATAPNDYRVLPSPGFHVPCGQGNCAVPDTTSLVVKDATGAKVGLLIDPDKRVDSPQRMQVRICPFTKGQIESRPAMDQCKVHLVAAGDSFTDLGMQVKVEKLWWMSDDKNDALDAVITTA
jgi:hypothetical protein